MVKQIGLLGLLFLGALPAAAQDKTVRARLGTWLGKFDGTIQGDGDALSGTKIDVDDVFGINDSPPLLTFGLEGEIPFLGGLVVDYWRGEFEGDNILANALAFAGVTFPTSSLVDATLTAQVVDLEYEYVFSLPIGSPIVDVRLGPRLGVKALFLNLELEAPGIAPQDADAKGGTPVVGAMAEVGIGSFFSVLVEVDGFKVGSGLSGIHGRVVDFRIAALFKYGAFFVGVDYRTFSLDIDDDRTNVKESLLHFSIAGPSFEVGFQF